MPSPYGREGGGGGSSCPVLMGGAPRAQSLWEGPLVPNPYGRGPRAQSLWERGGGASFPVLMGGAPRAQSLWNSLFCGTIFHDMYVNVYLIGHH